MKVFFAAGENTSASRVLQWAKAPNVLMYYYYLRNRKQEAIDELIRSYKASGNEMLMLDSGAHTFFTQAGEVSATSDANKGKELKLDPDEYFEQYANWLDNNQQYFDIIVELDIGKIVGMEKVKKWRQILKGIVGDKLMVVHHPNIMSTQELEEMCKEYKYTAVGAGMRNELSAWNTYARIALKYGSKMHGLASTKDEVMKRVPLFSVDSTSWKMGSKFGISYIFQNNKMISVPKEGRRRYKDFFISKGINWELLSQDNGEEVDKMCALAWVEYEAYINKSQMPTESKEIKYDPTTTLPEETKGKIMEIRSNPEIEEKRNKAMMLNLNNFKSGKYAKKLPLYCNNCYAKDKCKFFQEPKDKDDMVLCALHEDYTKWFSPEDFDYRDEEIVSKTRNAITDKLLHRLGIQLYFEMLDGGIQDKSATALALSIIDRISPKVPLFQQTNNTISVEKNLAIVLNKLDEPTREKIIGLLRAEFGESGQEQVIVSDRESTVSE